MIFNSEPNDWKDLEIKVCKIFQEIGCEAENKKNISTVRGDVEIDVYVEDNTKMPRMLYFCECKYWNNPIPQHVIHSFQTVVANAGANLGYIISKKGFQSGAYESVNNSNVKLLTWDEFQALYFETWVSAMFKKSHELAKPCSIYFEYMSGPPRDEVDHKEFIRLGEKYELIFRFSPYLNTFSRNKKLELPVKVIDPRGSKNVLDEIVITSYRDLFDIFLESVQNCQNSWEEFRAFLREKHGSD